VTEALLVSRLAEHVERIDTDMALEYQVRCRGGGRGAQAGARRLPI
jgi:ribosomal protein S9